MCHASRLEPCVSHIWGGALCVTRLGWSSMCHAAEMEQCVCVCHTSEVEYCVSRV